MATHDYVIDNGTGSAVRADINLLLKAILTNNSGTTDPSTVISSDAGSKAFNKPCGCEGRRKTLNDLFPYGKREKK